MVDVVLELYLRRVEVYAGQIAGVVPHTAEVLYLVVTAHIPTNVVRVLHHNLGNGCRPRAAANNGYTTQPTPCPSRREWSLVTFAIEHLHRRTI